MAKYFEDYDKNTFTTSSDDDKINKKNNSGSYPAFRKPVFRGNSNGVENRFHSAANTPVQSGNKPYSYGIPMTREDKIAQSLGRSLNTALTNEKNRVKAIADKMSRDIEKTKQRQNGTQSAKRSDTSFALQDKNEAPLKAEKLSVVTPVPKEQKIYSGTPVNPEYAVSKTYGTEKEKDVFAVLKGMDEVTGKDDAGRYLRGRTEWLDNENRYLSAINNNAERKVTDYSKNNPDDMEHSGYPQLHLLSASEPLPDKNFSVAKSVNTKRNPVITNNLLKKFPRHSNVINGVYSAVLNDEKNVSRIEQNSFENAVYLLLLEKGDFENSQNELQEKIAREKGKFIKAFLRSSIANKEGSGVFNQLRASLMNENTFENDSVKMWMDLLVFSLGNNNSRWLQTAMSGSGFTVNNLDRALKEIGNQVINNYLAGKTDEPIILYNTYNQPEEDLEYASPQEYEMLHKVYYDSREKYFLDSLPIDEDSISPALEEEYDPGNFSEGIRYSET